jgi:hypothetical protein
MKPYILLLFIISANITFSQNYENVCTNGLTFYKDNAGNIKAFRLDSIYLPGNNDTVFFSYRTIWDWASYFCYDTTNGSMLGLKVYKKLDGWFYFFNRNHDTIKINSQATLNQAWKFCDLPSNQYIEAKVTAIQYDSILGTTDQVKILTFQAKDNLNNNVYNILNNRTIKLSQHYGLTKMLYVYYIPSDTTEYFLEGKSFPQMGLQDMTWRDVFDYNVGDVFHYSGYEGNSSPAHYDMIENILGKTFSSDSMSVTYTIERCKMVMWFQYYYFHDTLTEVYDTSAWPGEYSSIGLSQEFRRFGGYYASSFDATLSEYNQRLSKSTSPDYYEVLDTCWGRGNAEIYYNYVYTKGLGNTLYIYNNTGDYYFARQELVYYQRGNEIWGTPVSFDCNTLLGIDPQKSTAKAFIEIIPNPVETQAEVFIQCILKYDNISIVMYDYSGKIVLREQVNSNPFTLNRGDLPPGLYILVIYDKNDVIIGKKKIVLR